MAIARVSTASSQESTAVTSHSVSLPAGYSAGNLLVVVFAVRAGYDDVATPAGWTRVSTVGNPSTSDTKITVFRKIASGGEGSTLTVTSTSAWKSAHISHAFQDAAFGTTASYSSGYDTTVQHGLLLSPPGNAYWVSWSSWAGGVPLSAYPGDYPNDNIEEALTDCNLASATSGLVSSTSARAFTYPATVGYSAGGFWVEESLSSSIDVSLDSGTLTLVGGDVTPGAIFFDLGYGELSLSGGDVTPYIQADLESGELWLVDIDETLFTIFDPTYPDGGLLTLEGGDLDWLIAVNADLESADLELIGEDIGGGRDIDLESGVLELVGGTNLGCLRLVTNQIIPVDMSSAVFDLCLLPPVDAEHGDSFGVIIVSAGSRGITYSPEFATSPASPLSAKGDRVLFRKVLDEIYDFT